MKRQLQRRAKSVVWSLVVWSLVVRSSVSGSPSGEALSTKSSSYEVKGGQSQRTLLCGTLEWGTREWGTGRGTGPGQTAKAQTLTFLILWPSGWLPHPHRDSFGGRERGTKGREGHDTRQVMPKLFLGQTANFSYSLPGRQRPATWPSWWLPHPHRDSFGGREKGTKVMPLRYASLNSFLATPLTFLILCLSARLLCQEFHQTKAGHMASWPHGLRGEFNIHTDKSSQSIQFVC